MTLEIKLKSIKILMSGQNLIEKSNVKLNYHKSDQGQILRIESLPDYYVIKTIDSSKIKFSQLYLYVIDGELSIDFNSYEDAVKLLQLLELPKEKEIKDEKTMSLIEDSFLIDLKKNPAIGIDSKDFLKKEILKFINEYKVNPSYYGPFTVICQSSGFGKSKACLSLTEDFYVVYCCLRAKESTGYPKRSSLATHLLKPENEPKDFICYFNLFIDILNDEKIDCKTFFKNYGKEDFDGEKKLVNLFNEKVEKAQSNVVISGYSGSKTLLFVFDEASYLLPKHFFTIRKLLFKSQNNIFVLFLDTFSELSGFMPSQSFDPSERIRQLDQYLFDPIYLLPNWDVFVDESKIKNIQDTINFENVCMYGRVLWGSWMHTKNNSNGKYKDVENKKLLSLAIGKLICGKKDSDEFNSSDYLAILSSRVGVIKPKLMSSRQKLVAKHMAVCTFVDTQKGIFEIDYPSEPILAAAGAFLMNSNNKFNHMLDNLIESYESSLISQGDKGELIAKIILLRAVDHAFKYHQPSSQISLYLNTVRVGYFLRSLYGRCVEHCGDMENEWNCKSNYEFCFIKIIKKQIADYKKLLDGYINFNHFCKTDCAMKETSLLKALKRCAAIQCKINQAKIDFAIPVSLSAFDFNSISTLLVQVKLYEDPINVDYVTAFSGVSPKFFLDLGAGSPYLMLYMQLGGSQNDIKDIKSGLTFKGEEHKKQAIIYSEGISTLIFPNLGQGVDGKLNAFGKASRKLFKSKEDEEKSDVYHAIRFPLN